MDTATSGLKAAAIHITTNVPGKNPYVINLTGRALSFVEDTDGDGMNDASELLLSPLGFNWQLGQPELVQGLFINANSVGLYTPSQIQALNVETSLLIRDAATGQFTIDIGLEKSNNLQDFTAFPFLAPQTSIQPNGKIRFEFTLPDNAAFLRLQKQ